MTKTTLNALLAGGGLLATWLAVTPNPAVPPASNLASTSRTAAVRDVTVDDLNLQEARLREHLGSVPLRPTGRNPFRFGKGNAEAPATAAAPIVSQASAPPAPAAPTLSL